MRSIVREFANVMEEVLQENDHKGGWDNMSSTQLRNRLDEEFIELAVELIQPTIDAAKVRREAADVANFAMFIYDRFGRVNKESEFV